MFLIVSMLLTACGGAVGAPACTPEPFDGTLFLADDAATGAVSGTATWPESVSDGLDVEVGLSSNAGYQGATSGSLFALPSTCGGALDFRISGVDPGTYAVVVRVQAADQPDTGDIAYLAEGTSEPVTVTDGEVSGVSVAVSLVE